VVPPVTREDAPEEAHPAHMLHDGPHSVIYRDAGAGTVTKVYRDAPHRTPQEAAEVEFARMQRYHRALSSADGVLCPRPVARGERDGRWYLRMEEVPGTALLQLMHDRTRPPPRAVARHIACALEVYAEAFDEPHYGLKPQDILVDTASGRVAVLDFEPCSKPSYLSGTGNELHPAAASAAILLGLALHLAAAPHQLRTPRAARWLVEVAAETVDQTEVAQPEEVRDVVRAIYRKRYEKGGKLHRQLWYQLRWVDLAGPFARRLGDGHRERGHPEAPR
jgi:serine/threonine protein kinase